jgi:hypothetical protein
MSSTIASPQFDIASSHGELASPQLTGIPSITDEQIETPLTQPSIHSIHETLINVMEEPWSEEMEQLVKHWRVHSIKMSELHEKAGYYVKSKHNIYGLPPIILPLTMSFVSQIIPDEEHTGTLVNGLMFLVSGLSGAVYKWLNLAEKYALHFQYSARYDDLITSIDSELSRQKRFRQPADTFITEIRCKIDNLNHTSPEFPACCMQNITCCGCNDIL